MFVYILDQYLFLQKGGIYQSIQFNKSWLNLITSRCYCLSNLRCNYLQRLLWSVPLFNIFLYQLTIEIFMFDCNTMFCLVIGYYLINLAFCYHWLKQSGLSSLFWFQSRCTHLRRLYGNNLPKYLNMTLRPTVYLLPFLIINQLLHNTFSTHIWTWYKNKIIVAMISLMQSYPYNRATFWPTICVPCMYLYIYTYIYILFHL